MSIGKIYCDKGLQRKSDGFIKQSQKIFLKLKNNNGLIECYNLLAINQAETGNIQKAAQNFDKCLSITKYKKDLFLRAIIEMNLGAIYLFLHNFQLSLYYSHLALHKFESRNDFTNIVKIRYNIGNCYYEMDKLNKALNEYDKSISISMKYGLILNVGRVYHNKALLYLKKEDMNMAIAYWQKSLEIYEKINDPILKFLLLLLRGIISMKQNKYKAAENLFFESRTQLLKYNNKLFIADIEINFGELYKEWGKYQKALNAYENAIKIYRKMNAPILIAKTANEIKKIKSDYPLL